MTQKVTLLNGVTVERDTDYTAFAQTVLRAGVVSGLAVTSGSVAAGIAFIKVTRTSTTPDEDIIVKFENTAAVTIDTTGTKKVWIEITQANVNDPGLNLADGTGVGSIQTGASYPASNYIPLASISSGTITDARVPVTAVARDLNGNEYPIAVDTNGNLDLGFELTTTLVTTNSVVQDFSYEKVIYVWTTDTWNWSWEDASNRKEINSALSEKRSLRAKFNLEEGVDYHITQHHTIIWGFITFAWNNSNRANLYFDVYDSSGVNRFYTFKLVDCKIMFSWVDLRHQDKVLPSAGWHSTPPIYTQRYWLHILFSYSRVVQSCPYFFFVQRVHARFSIYSSANVDMSWDAVYLIKSESSTIVLNRHSWSITSGYKYTNAKVWQNLVTDETNTSMVDYAFAVLTDVVVPANNTTNFSVSGGNCGDTTEIDLGSSYTIPKKWVYRFLIRKWDATYVKVNIDWVTQAQISSSGMTIGIWPEVRHGSYNPTWSSNMFEVIRYLNQWDVVQCRYSPASSCWVSTSTVVECRSATIDLTS